MIRFQNILISIIVLAFSLCRGNAKQQVALKRVVVVYPTNNIGDMVCATPLFRAIKQYNSAIHITVIGSSKNEVLLAGNSDIDEYLIDTAPWWTLVKQLKREKTDAGIVIGSSVQNFATLFFGGVKNISCFGLIGKYRTKEPRPYKIISRLAHRIPYMPGEYVPEQYLRLLEPLGIKAVDCTKHLECSEDARNFVEKQLTELGVSTTERVVVIAPGAGARYKQWPAERFADVGNYIYEKFNIPLIIIGSKDDQNAVAITAERLSDSVRCWRTGPQSLDYLKAIISRASLVIGNDSGAIHVGEAFDVMTITLAGMTDVGEHLLESESHRILASENMGVQYRAYFMDERHIDTNLALQQMMRVTVPDVIACVDSLLGEVLRK